MRILLLPSAYFPHSGGVEELTRQLAQVYVRMGHDVMVIAPLWPHNLPPTELVKGQRIMRVAMPLPRAHWRSLASFMLRAVPSVARLILITRRWAPDVAHVQCVGPNGLYALILAKCLDLPIVVTSQGEQTMDATGLYDHSRMQRWVLRRLLRRANAVTACSTDALHNLGHFGNWQTPAQVIPNGVDPDEVILAAEDRPHDREYIFALGRHVWNKGFDVLLRAFASIAVRYPDVDLILAGDGPEREKLLHQVRELALDGRVLLPGVIGRAAVATYFKHGCSFVLSSFSEPFGIVCLEAMLAGKAVIATRAGGVPEFVTHERTGLLVPPNDAAALASAMARLLDDPNLATRLGRAGDELVHSRFTWQQISTLYLVLYERVLAAHHTHSTTQLMPPRIDARTSPSMRQPVRELCVALPEPSILCIGQEDWDEVWRRNQFLLAGLAQAGAVHRVLFVERPCDVTNGLRTFSLFRRDQLHRRKLALACAGPRRCPDHQFIWLLTPIKFLPNSIPAMRRLNQWLERLQVRCALRRIHMLRPVLWTQNPEAAHWLRYAPNGIIYDATDDWSQMTGSKGWLAVVLRGQELLACGADTVLACSPTLYDKWKPLNEHTHLLRNGVNLAHYSQVGTLEVPSELSRVPRPVLGYTGTLHDARLDIELICRVAAHRPQWQLVFIGPDLLGAEARARLRRLSNIHLLGQRAYKDLPAYMSAFSVCILPHLVNPFTESLNPIKIYEYLATGLPIVSTPVSTVRELGDLVHLAEDAQAFVTAAEIVLAESGSAFRNQRRAFAAANSWDGRIECLTKLLTTLRNRKSETPGGCRTPGTVSE